MEVAANVVPRVGSHQKSIEIPKGKRENAEMTKIRMFAIAIATVDAGMDGWSGFRVGL
ncbi:MAG: hypothetical protein U0792_18230 [Gemmataceae bacterium]